MTRGMSSIRTCLAGARGQTVVLAVLREYKWGSSFHVSGSHTVRRDSGVMWEFLGALSLCSAFLLISAGPTLSRIPPQQIAFLLLVYGRSRGHYTITY